MADSGIVVAEMAGGLSGLVQASRLNEIQRTFDEEASIHKMLKKWVGDAMTSGVDYGVIPGTDKPTLLKPGAEKLLALFKCGPTFKLVRCTEDFGDRPFFNYMFRVRLVNDSGKVLAEGFGSANSHEARYRWRSASRKCPVCGKEAIIKGKAEFGGGWICFAKKGGCGQKWADGAEEIERQESGRVENDDVATLANTILKMAKKRALVDGAIALARVSDLFTQDAEDLHVEDAEDQRRAEPSRNPRAATVPPAAVLPPFGNAKGQPIAGQPMETLELYRGALLRSVADPDKARFKDANQALVTAIEKEMEAQRTAKAAPPKPTPAQVKAENDAREARKAKVKVAAEDLAKECGVEVSEVGKALRAKGITSMGEMTPEAWTAFEKEFRAAHGLYRKAWNLTREAGLFVETLQDWCAGNGIKTFTAEHLASWTARVAELTAPEPEPGAQG